MRVLSQALEILSAFLQFRGDSAPDVSPSGGARLWYDRANNALKVSLNGAAYSSIADLVTGGVTATAAELNTLGGVTAGAVSASKALVVDASKDLAGARFFNTSGGSLAAAGNAQGNAGAVITENVGVTGADGTKGVRLPTAVAGMFIRVNNTVAGQNLKVYPASGGAIDAAAADAAYTLAGAKSALFFAVSATQWYSCLSA